MRGQKFLAIDENSPFEGISFSGKSIESNFDFVDFLSLQPTKEGAGHNLF